MTRATKGGAKEGVKREESQRVEQLKSQWQ